LRTTLGGIFARLDNLGTEIEDRIESAQYLAIARKAFREWDQADTQQKRDLIVHLITNAAGTRVCSDDILRLFLDWIELYHEAHCAVIGEIYKNPGSTRYDIWVAVYGSEIPRDDSADADLFKMLIRDLNIGGVIRLPRESDDQGRFRKRVRPPGRVPKTSTMESAFEDSKPWVLTELGGQFVHYQRQVKLQTKRPYSHALVKLHIGRYICHLFAMFSFSPLRLSKTPGGCLFGLIRPVDLLEKPPSSAFLYGDSLPLWQWSRRERSCSPPLTQYLACAWL